MSRSWIPPPHSLVQSVQLDHGLILHPRRLRGKGSYSIWCIICAARCGPFILNVTYRETNLDAQRRPQPCPVCSSFFHAVPCVVSSHHCLLVLYCTSWSYTSSSGWLQDSGLHQTEAPASPCASGLYDLSRRTYYTLTTRSTRTWHSLWLRRQVDKKTKLWKSRKLEWEW